MLKDHLKLHFIVLLWGITSILGKVITVPPIELVFYRTLLASITLALIILFIKKTFKIDKTTLLKMLGTGAIIGLHWIAFFASVKVSKVSICLAGISTTALFTAILEPLFNNTKHKTYEIFLGLIVILGLYIIYHFEFNHALGLTFALIAAVLAAIFTIFNAKLAKTQDPTITSFYEMSSACIVCILFFPIYTNFFAQDPKLQLALTQTDLFYLAILVLACTVYPLYASIQLLKKLSAFYINLTVNMEPIYGIILALFIFPDTEKMKSGFYLGTLTILLSVIAYPILNKRYNPKHKPLTPTTD